MDRRGDATPSPSLYPLVDVALDTQDEDGDPMQTAVRS